MAATQASVLQAEINTALANEGLLKAAQYITQRGKSDEAHHPVNVAKTRFKRNLIDGDAILITDIEIIMTQNQIDFEPLPGQYINIGGIDYALALIDEDSLGVAYVFRGRR